MARRRTTVELDEHLLDATHVEAERTGRSAADVIEDALRRRFDARRPSIADQVWDLNKRDALTEHEALALAYTELDQMRAERGTRNQVGP